MVNEIKDVVLNRPTFEDIKKLKDFVDSTELEFRGGGILDGSLRSWDDSQMLAKSANVMGNLGTKFLDDSIIEWRKGYYICCICSGVACLCFFVAAGAWLILGDFGVCKVATKSGVV
jgi:hypothetical protein